MITPRIEQVLCFHSPASHFDAFLSSLLQYSDQQRRVKGTHPTVEDPSGYLQQHPDGAAAQALPTALRVL